jgi:hypothetical protein
MSTIPVHHRRDAVRRPVYRRPEWAQVCETSGSNTWGDGAARRPSPVQAARRLSRSRSKERPFDNWSRGARLRRRASSVLGSPGVTLVSLASVVVMIAASPVLTGTDEGVVTPTTTATVTVDEGASLSDIAREHVPGAPVGDAVARISSLNGITGAGDLGPRDLGQSDGSTTRQVIVPVY